MIINRNRIINLIKISFWCFFLPTSGLIALYYLIHHKNPFDNNLFLLAIIFCVPMIIVKTNEMENETFEYHLKCFREMTRFELQEAEQNIRKMILGRQRSMLKEAFCKVYKEKYGREIYF